MITRLEMVEKELVDKLKMASPKQQHKAAVRACEIAFQVASIHIPVVFECLKELGNGNKLDVNQINELEQLANQLDEKYFFLEDKGELGLDSLQLFSQARVVSALSCAGRDGSLASFADAIYEASAAINDSACIFDAVHLILSESKFDI